MCVKDIDVIKIDGNLFITRSIFSKVLIIETPELSLMTLWREKCWVILLLLLFHNHMVYMNLNDKCDFQAMRIKSSMEKLVFWFCFQYVFLYKMVE